MRIVVLYTPRNRLKTICTRRYIYILKKYGGGNQNANGLRVFILYIRFIYSSGIFHKNTFCETGDEWLTENLVGPVVVRIGHVTQPGDRGRRVEFEHVVVLIHVGCVGGRARELKSFDRNDPTVEFDKADTMSGKTLRENTVRQ